MAPEAAHESFAEIFPAIRGDGSDFTTAPFLSVPFSF